jgi:exosortase
VSETGVATMTKADAAATGRERWDAARIVATLTKPANALLAAGLAAITIPTFSAVAANSWSTEQGAHGPIILATGLWLLARQWPSPAERQPPKSFIPAMLALTVCLIGYVLARITQIVEVEGLAMFGAFLCLLYGLIGGRAMRALWFPLFYLAFTLPPPDQAVAALTQPLKILISQAAIDLLYAVGYPIGGEGVVIQIGQYQLLVAAACSGLNSLITLFALSLFYVYLRHRLEVRYAMLLVAIVIPVAIFANFVRVLILILLTYHSGEAVAQGFMHNFAGLAMFMIAISCVFLVDLVLHPIWQRFTGGDASDGDPA